MSTAIRSAMLGTAALCWASTGAPAQAPVDVTTWDLASWRVWPFEYEELSTREAPFLTEGSQDWIRTGDSWVGGNPSVAAPAAEVGDPVRNYTLQVTDFYVTGGGNETGPNRVFCASAVPRELVPPFPVLFVFHGGGGHASGALAVAIARKNPGFAAVAVDYNGQFRPSALPVTRWATLTEEIRERRHDLVPNALNFPMYHNVQATRRVLDWAETQPWADPNRFGAVGISYGGWLSFILAGVDERVRSVYTGVSAGGTEGTRGRSSQALDWQPAEQRRTWLDNAVPMAHVPRPRIPVFMNLATNDRFFWLSGAARHRHALGERAEWLLTPNCDHGNGGPELPDPSGLWHRMIHMGGAPFPAFGEIDFTENGDTAVVAVGSRVDLRSVHLAWSPGDWVAPARYWRWIEAQSAGGTWSATLPTGHADLEGLVYFTAIDADGRAVSSVLVEKPGRAIGSALIWTDDALWDVAMGAAAWRPNLSFGKVVLEDAKGSRIRITPGASEGRIGVVTNSLMLSEEAREMHRGIRIELTGNGSPSRIRVILARDYTSLAEQLFAVEMEVPATGATLDLPWERFAPHGRATAEPNVLPANGLALECEALPPAGITVGKVTWLE